MKKAKYIVLIAIVSVLGFSKCSPAASTDSHDESGHVHGKEEEEEPNSDYIVHLKPEQLKVMDIQIGEFKMMNLNTTVKTNGQLELPPQNKASLSAVIAGRVKNVMIIEGQEVRKGQVLAIMENPEAIDLQQEYLSLKSELAFVESDFKRKEELYNDSIGSAKDYQRVKSQFESLKAEFYGVKAKLKLLNYSASQLDNGTISSTFNVISPIEGHVRLVEINIGKFVQPEQEMFENC